jgi:phage terminase large subunit GpA-like protein
VLGPVRDPGAGAWAQLTELAHEKALVYKRSDGREFAPVCTLVDSGDGTNLDTVYQFAASRRNTYACAGADMLKKKQDAQDKGPLDEMSRLNFDRYRVTRQRQGHPVIMISTNHYKHLVYNSLKIPFKPAAEQQSPGFCSFPQDYPEAYFEMLVAEERRTDGSFYCPSGRRNEALDLRVYNLAARDFYMDSKVQELRDYYRKKGATRAQLDAIRSPRVLEALAAAVKRRN